MPLTNLQLEDRIKTLEKDVSTLKDTLNVYENWNSEIKDMYGKRVLITTHSQSIFDGKLIWTDRYCVCIERKDHKRVTLNKGGIVSIELA